MMDVNGLKQGERFGEASGGFPIGLAAIQWALKEWFLLPLSVCFALPLWSSMVPMNHSLMCISEPPYDNPPPPSPKKVRIKKSTFPFHR